LTADLISIAIIQFIVLVILAVTAVNLFSTTKSAAFRDFFSGRLPVRLTD
jgi:hypothetical protein